MLEALAEPLRREMAMGRGGRAVAPFPVVLEPPFSPFRHAGQEGIRGKSTGSIVIPRASITPLTDLRCLRLRLSPQDEYVSDLRERFLLGLSSSSLIAFELAGHDGKLRVQFVVPRQVAPLTASQAYAHYPKAQASETPDPLQDDGARKLVARAYRLRESHLFEIRVEERAESYVALAGVLTALREGEFGFLQVLFQPVRHPWHDNILRVASDPWDASKSAFVDLPDLPRRARAKVERPLFAVAVRIAASGATFLDRLERSLLPQLESGENGLLPIGASYPVDAVVGRFTRTPGMLLNARELAALVHLPDPKGLAPGTLELAVPTAKAPPAASAPLVVLGVNRHRGEDTRVGIDEHWMARHAFIQGATGTGKSTLLKVILTSLMEKGHGLAFLDYAGDAAEELLDLVPERRVEDVVYFNPGDRLYPPALNLLQPFGREQEMLASELMVGLKRIFQGKAEFGPRMEWILRQAVRTLLASQGEKTLRDVPRLLTDADYREGVVATVPDQELQEFWRARGTLSSAVTDPILNRLSTFLDRPTVRNIVCQPGLIDLARAMNSRKIVVFNLSKGILGEENSQVLGSLILAKLQLAAMARAELPIPERHLFVVACDEFHNHAGAGLDTTSVRSFLSEARKYGVALVTATQYISQLDRQVVAAVFGNVGTLVCFRCGVDDSQALGRELGTFKAEDLLNLETGQAIVRMGRASDSFNLDVPFPKRPVTSFRDRIVQLSRARYCRPVSDVEAMLRKATQPPPAAGEAGERSPSPAAKEDRARESGRSIPGPPRSNTGDQPVGAEVPRVERQANPKATGKREFGPHKELLTYLEHVAEHPFLPALQRDGALGLSKYKGAVLRQRLIESGWVKAHKVDTGRRSGQLVILEVTDAGYEFLGSMKVRVHRPRGRGSFLHKYYAHKLKEYAEATWPGCTASVEDGTAGRPVDVLVRVPASAQGGERSIAFEVFLTGEDKEIQGIAKDVQLFDRVVVCSAHPAALHALKSKATEIMGEGALKKVSFNLLSQYLMSTTEAGETSTSPETTPPTASSARPRPSDSGAPRPSSSSEKSRAKPEPGAERRKPPASKRGRKPKAPLLKQVEDAYLYIHDLDRLQDSPLIELEAVRERVNPKDPMPEVQALRGLLVNAAKLAMKHMEGLPEYAHMKLFMDRYLQGKRVAEIAKELGVTREWCSRNYRKGAIGLAAMQFVRLVSMEEQGNKV